MYKEKRRSKANLVALLEDFLGTLLQLVGDAGESIVND
jgi:hypothetical protein